MFRLRKSRTRRAVVSLLAGATVLQFGFLDSCTGILTVFNPCGTVFGFCEQEDLDLLLAGNIPDWDLDPTCTIPYAVGNGCAGGPIWPTPGPRPD